MPFQSNVNKIIKQDKTCLNFILFVGVFVNAILRDAGGLRNYINFYFGLIT